MQLTIVNLTGSTKTYLSGTVTVAGLIGATTSVTNIVQQFSLATDGQLRSDLLASLVQITDGVNTYAANDALDYLQLISINTVKIASGYTYFHPVFSSRVQSASGANGLLSASQSVSITSTASGNLIVVCVASSVAGTVTVTDNLSQTYTLAISGTSGTHTNYIFYKANTASGVTSVTASSTVNSGIEVVVAEYSGVSGVTLDKTSTGTVTGASAFSSGSTATTTTAVELLIGSANGTTKNNSTYTAGTNWNTVALTNGFNAGAGQLFMEDQFVLSTGAYSATGTASANDTIVADIATFALPNAPSNLVLLNTAKVIKTGPGVLAGVTVNIVGTGSATATLYDGTSTTGTVLAIISLTSGQGNLPYNVSFTTGLTLVMNSTSADITVQYA